MNEANLAPEVHDSIFKLGILGPSLKGTSRADKPIALFVGGQPGCGKSTVARTSRQWFAGGNFVHVDVDKLRELHPQYLPLVTNPATERQAPSAVQRDCSTWADMLREEAAVLQRNMLLESSMRVPAQFRESVKDLKANGYTVEVRVIAVHEKVSEVALAQRFEHEKRVLGYGREIPAAYHDLASSGIVDTVRMLEAEGLVDRLVISDRAGRTIYDNQIRDGVWDREPNGAEVMLTHREASYDLDTRNKIRALWADVRDMMAQRGATPAEQAFAADKADEAHRAVVASRRAGYDVGAIPSDDQSVCSGRFCGKVLELRDGGEMVVQKFGRDPDRVAVHKAHLLSRVPDVGEVVEIQYKAGLGQVSAREKGMELSR